MSAGRTPDPGAAVVSTPSLLALAVTAFVVEVAMNSMAQQARPKLNTHSE